MTRRNTSHTHCSSFDYLYGWLLPPQIDHLPAPPQILNPKMHKSFNLPGIPRKWSQQLLPASFLFWDEDRQVGVSSPCRLWKFRFSSGSGFWWLLGDENHLLGPWPWWFGSRSILTQRWWWWWEYIPNQTLKVHKSTPFAFLSTFIESSTSYESSLYSHSRSPLLHRYIAILWNSRSILHYPKLTAGI